MNVANRKNVLVTYNLPHEWFREAENFFNFIFPEDGDGFTEEEVLSRIVEADGLLSMFSFNVGKNIIERGANARLKIISNFGVGYNNIDVKSASDFGIVVTNTPDPVVEPTAELAFALMGDVARGISLCDRGMRLKESIRWGVMQNISLGLYGKTLGVIGLGRIGLAVARRALASGMRVIYHNRHERDDDEKTGCSYVSLDELLSTSDFVSLHTPLDETSYHLIDHMALSKMKPTAFLINTARGAVVDESALVEALASHTIMGAALDVYEFEPQVSAGLLALDKVVVVPHIGTATLSARMEMARFAIENMHLFFSGEKPLSRIV